MQKDLKTGMILGLILAAAAALWLSTRPWLSTKARIRGALQSHNTNSRRESIEQPLPPVSPLQTTAKPDFTLQKQPKNLESNKKPATSYEPQATMFHIVRKGETLSGIAYRYYGSANKWQKILDANRKTIKDANTLRPGTKLIIPE